ncbi:RGS-domain-containing protein [Westerdykella ornata]|uniref:RGS-domain-containing protein n=1 Tax=Westerdykella ornata TaxID=318751 RepID=A0A6A6JET8_WESOR|nr:RGS-domain-containing protein [Westerdykella ornata]KAF2275130.1 RGS-domain-containing protein [Westerdykella ornata]
MPDPILSLPDSSSSVPPASPSPLRPFPTTTTITTNDSSSGNTANNTSTTTSLTSPPPTTTSATSGPSIHRPVQADPGALSSLSQSDPSPPPSVADETAAPPPPPPTVQHSASLSEHQPHPQNKQNKQKQPSKRRRSTLTSRFPLLRKAARDVSGSLLHHEQHPSSTAAPSRSHLRSTSRPHLSLADTDLHPLPFPADSRTSTSSSRGRSDPSQAPFDTHQPPQQFEENPHRPASRASSSTASTRSLAHEPTFTSDSASVPSSTPLAHTNPSSNPSPLSTITDANTANTDNSSQSNSQALRKGPERKMHQTSSRLLRMTEDERPFTRHVISTKLHHVNLQSLSLSHSLAKLHSLYPLLFAEVVVTGTLLQWEVDDHSPGNDKATTVHGHRYIMAQDCPIIQAMLENRAPPDESTCTTSLPAGRRSSVILNNLPTKTLAETEPQVLLEPKRSQNPWAEYRWRDFEDLFSTLMVSLPLTPHRVRFRMIEFTFTSDEAITNLGSLKFSQSNRMPDPKDPSRVVTTTTTTTFSMAKEMARSVCQKFLEAKFIESVENKVDFQNKGSVWQLTPKGIHILERFCSRNGIQSPHVKAVIESSRNPHQLVILERSTETDALHHDEQTVHIIFRRFVGPNVNETASSDSDSVHEFAKCDVGVRMIKHKPTTARPYEHVFTGKATVEWLMDCCTMVDRREGLEIGELFLQLNLIAPVDNRNPKQAFMGTKQSLYYVTPHGERVAGWVAGDEPLATTETATSRVREGATRDSNSNRTLVIINNPSWRLLYREFLKDTMCEENLSFYLEVHKVDVVRETLAAAYGLYNAFLAPGSPNELNIDHALRTQLATRMTRAVGDDTAMEKSLEEVAKLFENAQNSIFKLMSSDSVPKFIKHSKYAPQLRGLDAAASNAAQPTQSATTSRSS